MSTLFEQIEREDIANRLELDKRQQLHLPLIEAFCRANDPRGWNRRKIAPVRYRQNVRFFKEKITSSTDGRPLYILRYSLSLRRNPTKNIPVDSHQLALQAHTISGPHRRKRLQPFMPSSTLSQRPFH